MCFHYRNFTQMIEIRVCRAFSGFMRALSKILGRVHDHKGQGILDRPFELSLSFLKSKSFLEKKIPKVFFFKVGSSRAFELFKSRVQSLVTKCSLALPTSELLSSDFNGRNVYCAILKISWKLSDCMLLNIPVDSGTSFYWTLYRHYTLTSYPKLLR